jgi:hypothetical protein
VSANAAASATVLSFMVFPQLFELQPSKLNGSGSYLIGLELGSTVSHSRRASSKSGHVRNAAEKRMVELAAGGCWLHRNGLIGIELRSRP